MLHGRNLLKLTLIDCHLFKSGVSLCFSKLIANYEAYKILKVDQQLNFMNFSFLLNSINISNTKILLTNMWYGLAGIYIYI